MNDDNRKKKKFNKKAYKENLKEKLKMLHELNYKDKKFNKKMLKRHNGDVNLVIAEYHKVISFIYIYHISYIIYFKEQINATSLHPRTC